MSISRQQKERQVNQQHNSVDKSQNYVDVRPSSFVWAVDQIPDSMKKVVLFIRVSGNGQRYNGNLERQENALRAALPDYFEVINAVHYVGSAKRNDIENELNRVFKHAEKIGASHVVGISLSRFIRNVKFEASDTNKRNINPSKQDLEWLKNLANKNNVQLATIADPDLTATQDMAFISNAIRRNEGKQNIGRPKIVEQAKEKKESGYKIRQKQEWYAEICRLANREKWSTRRIAKHVSQESGVKITHETVNQWVKESNDD